MSRVRQKPGQRGSQRWIQLLVNKHSPVLDEAIGLGPITWRSPRAEDDYAEYRDETALRRLGLPAIELRRRSLDSFWPARGPQWDALGRASTGEVVLVEAKAHLGEMFSTRSQAGPASLRKIREALRDTASALRARSDTDWTSHFYQYANRLAHAHLLRTLNGIPTCLVFLYFVGDTEMHGPGTRQEWEAAITVRTRRSASAGEYLPTSRMSSST